MPRTLNPMDGCPDCKWIKSNYGTHLDQDGICDLHKAIASLQEDLAIERDVRKSQDGLIKEICKVVGATEEDDPAEVARVRIDEIAELEAALKKAEEDYAKLLAAA